MIGRVRFIHPLNNGEFGYRYKIQLVGSASEVMSCGTHDIFKLDDLVFCDSPEYEYSRVPIRRLTNQDIWDELAGMDDWDTPTEEVKEILETAPEKTSSELPSKKAEYKAVEPEEKEEEQKSVLEKNRLFVECFKSGDFVSAAQWLLLGADVDCGIGEQNNTLLLQSVSQNKLIATGFLLAVGAHPSSKNGKGVSANSFVREHSARVHITIASLLEEEMKLLKSKRRSPKNYQQNSSNETTINFDGIDAPMQNQDGAPNSLMPVGDAQFFQDTRNDVHDATRNHGYMAREDGDFGSQSGSDDYGDESMP